MSDTARRAFLVVSLMCMFALITSCASMESPKVMLTGVEQAGMTSEGLEFILIVDVRNPNDFGAQLGDLEYEVHVDGYEMARGFRSDVVTVPPNGSVEVDVPFTLEWKGARRILANFFDGEDHEWKIDGSLEVRKGVMKKTFTFTDKGSFGALFSEEVDTFGT